MVRRGISTRDHPVRYVWDEGGHEEEGGDREGCLLVYQSKVFFNGTSIFCKLTLVGTLNGLPENLRSTKND